RRGGLGPARRGDHRGAATARRIFQPRQPASLAAANRRRHLRTVSTCTPTCAAIATLVLPAAAASTICARSRSRNGPRADRARAINTDCYPPGQGNPVL